MCIAITQYTKTKNHNTNYYRRNKAERFNVLSCPHCNYETTGPKSALQAHIWSKHTLEHERPFQCPCSGCHRGFSARANLNKHILKQHNIIMIYQYGMLKRLLIVIIFHMEMTHGHYQNQISQIVIQINFGVTLYPILTKKTKYEI